MIYDCDDYRINLEYIKMLTYDKTHEDRLQLISSLAVATGVPIVVVCHFMEELWGSSEALTKKVDRLKAFYDVTSVLNNRGYTK